MRHYFATQYRLPSLNSDEGKRFSAYILATDDTINEVIARRGLKETVESGAMIPKVKNVISKPTLIFDRLIQATLMEEVYDNAHKLLHLVMFMLSIQEKKNKLECVGNLFDDLGLVHQIYHCLIMQPVFLGEDFKVSTRKQLSELEENFPEMFLTENEIALLKSLDNSIKLTTPINELVN